MRIRPGQVQENLKPPNAERRVEVTREQLPLHCPLPDTYLWNSHPKVYLPIEAHGHGRLPLLRYPLHSRRRILTA